jgi:hypothetical protein
VLLPSIPSKLIDFGKTKIPILWSEQLERFYGLTEKAA